MQEIITGRIAIIAEDDFDKLNEFDPAHRIMRLGSHIDTKLTVKISKFLSEIYNAPIHALKDVDITKDNKEICVELSSLGGSAVDSLAIYDMLKYALHPSVKVTTVATGLVASGASIIFCAGSERIITKHSRLMLHQPYYENEHSTKDANQNELINYLNVLASLEDNIVDIYVKTTGKKKKDIHADFLNQDFYLDGQAAVNYGLATRLI